MTRIRSLGCAILLVIALSAQAAEKVPTVGVLFNSVPAGELAGPDPTNVYAKAIVRGLRERGWIDGRNIRILWRSAEQRAELRPALIDELVRFPVDVLIIGGNFAAQDALRRTRSVPIVLPTSVSPERDGLVESLARPGGNVTGISVDPRAELIGKRLALLKQAAPKLSHVAFLVASHIAPERVELFLLSPETRAAARALGLTLFVQRFEGGAGIDRAIDEAVRQGADGLYVGDENEFYVKENLALVHRAARRHRLPAMYYPPGSAESGGLMSYTIDLVASFARTGYFVDRILKGTKPADLPIEQPARFELVVNLEAAKAIGLDLPASLLAQADRVIR